jgi:MATE family multidrug resistance protein
VVQTNSFIGAAWARAITAIIYPIMAWLYIEWSGLKAKFWDGWSVRALEGWWSWLAMGIPAMISIMADWCAWEFVGIMAGWLVDYEVALAANTILFNIESFTYMVEAFFSLLQFTV